MYNLNDIALIRLNEPVPLYSEDPSSSNAIPVCLPWGLNSPGRSLEDGTNVIVTGWGLTYKGEAQNKINFKKYGIRSTLLHKTKLPIASSKCTATEGEFEIDPSLQYCAGGLRGIQI